MRFGNLWAILTAVLLVCLFVGFERIVPVRASFTLTGLVDCGQKSGATCSLGSTIVIVSTDSGSPTKYTIDLSWLKGGLPKLDQDDQVTIEIEKLPDGTLMALNLTDTSNQNGTKNPGLAGAKSTTTTIVDNDPSVCVPNQIVHSVSTTTFSETINPSTTLTTNTATTTETFETTSTETSTTISRTTTTVLTTSTTTTTETTTSTGLIAGENDTPHDFLKVPVDPSSGGPCDNVDDDWHAHGEYDLDRECDRLDDPDGSGDGDRRSHHRRHDRPIDHRHDDHLPGDDYRDHHDHDHHVEEEE